MSTDWTPKSATPADDEWVPASARVPVSAHTRRLRAPSAAQLGARAGVESIVGQRGITPQVLEMLVGQLPVAGAIAGGVAGGPPGAGLGGIVGAGAQQMATGALGYPPPEAITSELLGLPEDSPHRVPLQMLESGAFGLAGEGVGPALKGLGRIGMRAAGRLTPEAAKVAMREGVAVTKAGLMKVGTKLARANEASRAILQRALARNPNRIYQAANIAKDVTVKMHKEFPSLALSGRPVEVMEGKAVQATGEYATLQKLNAEFIQSHPGPLTPEQLHNIRQTSDQLARGVYRKMESGEWANVSDATVSRWHKAVADWAREHLRMIPGYEKNQKLASQLIRLREEMFPRITAEEAGGVAGQVLRKIPTYPIGVTVGGALGYGAGEYAAGEGRRPWAPQALLGAALGAGLLSPQAMSKTSLALASPMLRRLLQLGVLEAGVAGQKR